MRTGKYLACPGEMPYNLKAVPPAGDLPMGGDSKALFRTQCGKPDNRSGMMPKPRYLSGSIGKRRAVVSSADGPKRGRETEEREAFCFESETEGSRASRTGEA